MPSVFTHFLILDSVTNALPASEASIIQANQEYAYWGSVGPDYFYFFEQDWSLLGDLASFTFKIYDDLEEVVGIFKTAQSFREDVENWISGGLTGDMQNLAKRVEVLTNALVAQFLTSNIDFFEQFTPPISDDASASNTRNWWLADLAHQRKTIDFARSLWAQSEGKPELRAYALGYLTHIGGDASGHPLVNLFVGGPYRSQWRRHGFIEKVQDSYYWHKLRHQRLSASSAHKMIEMSKPATGMLPDMPDALLAMIKSAIDENYAAFGLVNGLPDEDSINNMYRLYYRYLRSSSTLGGLNMPPPEDFDWLDLPDFVADELQKTWDKRPTGGLPPITNISDPAQWKNFLSGIIRSVLWLAEVVIKIATLPIAVVNRLATAPARYLIWLMEQAVYDLYKDLRFALAIGGYIHPEHEDVSRKFGEIVKPIQWSKYLEVYGFRHYTNSEQTYHLVHPFDFQPRPTIERPYETAIGDFPAPIKPLIYSGQPDDGGEAVERLFFDATLTDGAPELFDSGDHFAPQNGVPTQHPEYWRLPLPSAAAASIEIINRFIANGAAGTKNINLDGDRGYIWPTWESQTSANTWQSLADFKFRDW